jgi:hypothetical protein
MFQEQTRFNNHVPSYKLRVHIWNYTYNIVMYMGVGLSPCEKGNTKHEIKTNGWKRYKVSTKDNSCIRSLQIFLIRIEQSVREPAVLG